jgi:putative flippase GtrA
VIGRLFELLRFAATGTLAVALNAIIIFLLTDRLGWHYLVSITVCFVTVTLISFWVNRFWTFRKRNERPAEDLARYVTVTIIQLGVCLVGTSICVEILHMQYEVAVIALSVLFVPLSYLLHRRWSFDLTWTRGES